MSLNLFPPKNDQDFPLSPPGEDQTSAILLLLQNMDTKLEQLLHQTTDAPDSPAATAATLPDSLRRTITHLPGAEEIMAALAAVMERAQTPEALLEVIATSQDPAERIADIKGKLEAATQRGDELEARNRDLEQQLAAHRQEHENICRDLERVRNEHEQSLHELATSKEEAAKAQLWQKKANKLESELSLLHTLREKMWPSFLRIPAMSRFNKEWQRALESDHADPVLLSMFANLFAWNTAHVLAISEEHNNTQLLQDEISALHAFSRFLFAWFRANQSCPADEVCDIADQLAQTINQILENTRAGYLINTDVVALDDSYSARFMSPSPRSPQTGRVKEIHSWCIQDDEQSTCLRKATVLLY